MQAPRITLCNSTAKTPVRIDVLPDFRPAVWPIAASLAIERSLAIEPTLAVKPAIPEPNGIIGLMKHPASRAELFSKLDELGISVTTTEHAAVFTVAESEALERDIPGGHTKNLFLKDAKGRLFLVVAKSSTRIDLKQLHKRLDAARFSFGKPDLLMEVLGVPPGSVTAFAVMNDRDQRVMVIVDEALMAHDTINCHPLANTATTNIARDELLRFIRSCGHEPRIVAIAADD